MKAACFQGTGEVRPARRPEPCLLAPTDAIVRVSMAGLCGSDLHPFFGREAGLDSGTVMGHELVGEVVEAGSEVTDFKVGDPVFAPFSTNCGQCFYCLSGLTSRCEQGELFGWVQQGVGLHGCQSEYVRVPLANATLKAVPPGLDQGQALLLGDNLSTAYFCAEMAGVTPGGVYAVIGCGTVGLLAILAARQLGADRLIAIDPVAERRRMAESLGAEAFDVGERAVQRIGELTAKRGADAVMELVGIPSAQELAYRLIRPGGIMSVIGCHCTPHFAFSPVDAYDKNLTYRTGRCPARHYMDRLTETVCSGELDIEPFITHEFSIDQCEQAYDVFAHRKDGCLKAVFRFGD
ncbi:MAG: alcohol dehydrogenase catalytic domain-containing protein [Mariniblastus sp.]|nr:alcohol dehydrogenase catalytic domain-containing protein [Mariniblastus sp.]